ncbi:MAG: hypothetical protein AB2615_02970, partial [Candidatus Thiodiazotropha sp.]
ETITRLRDRAIRVVLTVFMLISPGFEFHQNSITGYAVNAEQKLNGENVRKTICRVKKCQFDTGTDPRYSISS